MSLTDHPDSICFWGVHAHAVIGLTRSGTLMLHANKPFEPTIDVAKGCLSGHVIRRLIGQPDHVRGVFAGLSRSGIPLHTGQHEPLMYLDLNQLRLPTFKDAFLRPVQPGDLELLAQWCKGYCDDTGGITSPDDMVLRIFNGQNAQLLVKGGFPAALTNLSARSDDIAQIADVYVPPDMRGQQCARIAVGLHLQQLRNQMRVTGALLSSSGPAATRCYQSLGFQVLADYLHVTLDAPLVVSA